MVTVKNNSNKIEKNESVILGTPKDYPHEMVDKLKEILPSIDTVNSAYLLLMIRNKKDKSFLIVVDTNGNLPNVFEKIANIATKYLKSDEKIDFVSLNDSFGKKSVQGEIPFYKRK